MAEEAGAPAGPDTDDTVIVALDEETTRPLAETGSASSPASGAEDRDAATASAGEDTARIDAESTPSPAAPEPDATAAIQEGESVAEAAAPLLGLDERARPADPLRTEGDIPTNRVSPGGSTPAVKPMMVHPVKRRRGALRPAPVPPGYGGRAVLGAGAGAVATYRPRAIPRPPAAPQALAMRTARRDSEGVASMGRRSRRLAVATMGGFSLSLVVSVVGLVLIARSAILGY